MVLYEDLRIYTIWRTDMARAKQDQDPAEYQKSPEEWEILGELAERLHHPNEAIEAYQACLRIRFSPKAMKGVLKMYERQGKYQETLQAMIRLIAWQYRWYSEVCSPFPQFVFFIPFFPTLSRLGVRFWTEISHAKKKKVLSCSPPHHPQTHRKRRRR